MGAPPGSQSLLHQVINSVQRQKAEPPGASSRNPFFIRSSIQSRESITNTSKKTCRNPFFIRSSIQSTGDPLRSKCGSFLVAIPSSSGHQFSRPLEMKLARLAAAVAIPSSSGHQFSQKEKDRNEINYLSQSLLHQVINSVANQTPQLQEPHC